jgi:hypothetical protein
MLGWRKGLRQRVEGIVKIHRDSGYRKSLRYFASQTGVAGLGLTREERGQHGVWADGLHGQRGRRCRINPPTEAEDKAIGASKREALTKPIGNLVL